MGYQPRVKSPRTSGRGSAKSQRERAKAKERKRRSIGSSILEENHVATTEEIMDRTVNRLRNLGSQRFAPSPYSEHFGRWLSNLMDVLSDFEFSSNINADHQFVKERSQILSNVELELEERRRKEVSLGETIKGLSDSRVRLERIEEEYASVAREVERRKNSEIKRLHESVDSLRAELNEITRMKTGLFRGISRKAKTQKETETTQRIENAQRELALANEEFTAEQERLRDEYETKKQPIIKQIREYEKEINNQETDGSIENRRVACEDLINLMHAFLHRKTLQPH